jgi:hypothetical protein
MGCQEDIFEKSVVREPSTILLLPHVDSYFTRSHPEIKIVRGRTMERRRGKKRRRLGKGEGKEDEGYEIE